MTGTGGAVACIDKVSGALTGLVTLSGATHSRFNLNGSRQVELEDCTLDAAPHVSPAGAANNTVTVRTVWRCSPNFYHDVPNATAVVVETFRPSSSAIGGVDWDMTITSPSVSPWSTAVHSHLSFSGGHAAAGGSSSEGGKMWVGGPRKASLPTATYDPLAPFNASELGGYTKFYYGGTMNDINDPHQTPSAPAQQLPVMVRINAFDNASVGVLQSPRDTPVVAYTEVSPGAATGRNQGVDMSFVRQYQRFCNTCTPATFRQHILAGGGGWRTIVAQYQSIYPSFFHPAVNTSMVDGPGSYADLRGPPDINASAAERYRGYGYTFNWDSTARFPCHGEWIPTAQDGYNETWLTCFAHAAPDHHTNEPCSTTSFTEIASWWVGRVALKLGRVTPAARCPVPFGLLVAWASLPSAALCPLADTAGASAPVPVPDPVGTSTSGPWALPPAPTATSLSTAGTSPACGRRVARTAPQPRLPPATTASLAATRSACWPTSTTLRSCTRRETRATLCAGA